MDQSVRSDSRLEVSVSFGRFDNDALAWEKWSSFSPNKYLEEVGSLSTPGSVAQKKAYFEAHYKKIAAQKAEEAEQDKPMDPEVCCAEVSSKENGVANSPEICYKSRILNGVKSIGEVEEEDCLTVSSNEDNTEKADNNIATFSGGDETRTGRTALTDAITLEEGVDGTPAVSYRSYVIEETEDELIDVDLPELNARRDAELGSLETSQKNSQDIVEKSSGRKDIITQPGAIKKENSKLNTRNVAQKVIPTKKEKNLSGTRKKVASPATKPLEASTPRSLKPASMSTPISASQSLKNTTISASQSLKKKVDGSPQLKSKMTLIGEKKRIPSTSFHMSLNSGPTNSLASLSMTRKSLIMEKMGDKDIVKRAFKTFQTSVNVPNSAEKTSTVKHILSTPVEPKISNFRTHIKGNERLKKDTDKGATPRSQPGARSNPLPAGSYKLSALDKKNAVGLSPLRKTDEKAEKRKEFLKKLEAKSIARVAENAQQIAKSKVGIKNEKLHRPTPNS